VLISYWQLHYGFIELLSCRCFDDESFASREPSDSVDLLSAAASVSRKWAVVVATRAHAWWARVFYVCADTFLPITSVNVSSFLYHFQQRQLGHSLNILAAATVVRGKWTAAVILWATFPVWWTRILIIRTCATRPVAFLGGRRGRRRRGWSLSAAAVVGCHRTVFVVLRTTFPVWRTRILVICASTTWPVALSCSLYVIDSDPQDNQQQKNVNLKIHS